MPWELIHFPDTPAFDWEAALLEKFRKDARVVHDYCKMAVNQMWKMQVGGRGSQSLSPAAACSVWTLKLLTHAPLFLPLDSSPLSPKCSTQKTATFTRWTTRCGTLRKAW